LYFSGLGTSVAGLMNVPLLVGLGPGVDTKIPECTDLCGSERGEWDLARDPFNLRSLKLGYAVGPDVIPPHQLPLILEYPNRSA
jgi:hypothetical protein